MRRSLRITTYLVCGAAALLTLFHLEENWRGKRAWESWKAQRLAMGDRYDWSELAPPMIPDADNFAKEPLIEAAVTGKASLMNGFKWGGKAPKFANWRLGQTEDVAGWAASFGAHDLSSALRPIDERLDELDLASKRPGCRMPFRYQYPEIAEDPIPPLLGFRAASRLLRLRAIARLRAGDASGAFEDAMAGLRLARQFQRDPALMSSLLAQAMSSIAMQSVWEGLSAHAWTDPQLAELQAALGRLDLIASFRRASESERIFMVQADEAEARKSAWQRAKDGAWDLDSFDGSGEVKTNWLKAIRLWLLVPNGWHYQGMVRRDKFLAEAYLPAVDPGAHTIHLARLRADESDREQSLFDRSVVVASGLLVSQVVRVAYHQNALDEARIACALERYRLAHGTYPASLDELVPAYLDQIPVDVLEGGALRYRLNADGTFLLYSMGPDGKDEDGKVALGKQGGIEIEQGDWAWSSR